MPRYKVNKALQHYLDKYYTLSEVLSIIYIGIHVCKHLYLCTNSLKCGLIILNKCVQHRQLHINNTLDGIIAFTMHAADLKNGSYITAIFYK